MQNRSKKPAPVAKSIVCAACLAALTLAFLAPRAAAASDAAKLEKKGKRAFAQGDYKKAGEEWSKMVVLLQDKAERAQTKKHSKRATEAAVEDLETAYRRLGECALRLRMYDSADQYLQKARESSTAVQKSDSDLEADLKELAANYRLLDLSSLGPDAAEAIRNLRPDRVSVSKLENGQGHHVAIVLANDMSREVGRKGVTHVGLEKNTSFDLLEGDNGDIIVSNITGVKVRASIWINIVNSSLKRDENKKVTAVVTGRKFGFTQSITAPVPDNVYQPVATLVGRVKGLFDDGVQTTGSGTTAATSATTTTTTTVTTADPAPDSKNTDK